MNLSLIQRRTLNLAPLRRGLGGLVLLAGLAVGCHKSAPVAVAPPPTSLDPARDAAPQPTDLPLNPQMQTIAPGQDTEAVLGQLTAELRRYVRYTHTPPHTFEEFASKDPITYPPPPAGKKYVIAAGQVILK